MSNWQSRGMYILINGNDAVQWELCVHTFPHFYFFLISYCDRDVCVPRCYLFHGQLSENGRIPIFVSGAIINISLSVIKPYRLLIHFACPHFTKYACTFRLFPHLVCHELLMCPKPVSEHQQQGGRARSRKTLVNKLGFWQLPITAILNYSASSLSVCYIFLFFSFLEHSHLSTTESLPYPVL